MKNEIHAAHILVKVAENASPEDTLAAYNRIMAIKKRIENGEDFATAAKGKNGSDDPSATRNGGDLGYFTAFQMVYQFEEAAYNTPVGKISNPVRTKFGYHLIKVIDLRPARGTIKAAHIMVATGKEADPEEIEAARKKVDEVNFRTMHKQQKKEVNYHFSEQEPPHAWYLNLKRLPLL
jgi:peptidyl-prolyl cis-trans isomerase SurA